VLLCLAAVGCGVKPRLVYTDVDGVQHAVGLDRRRPLIDDELDADAGPTNSSAVAETPGTQPQTLGSRPGTETPGTRPAMPTIRTGDEPRDWRHDPRGEVPPPTQPVGGPLTAGGGPAGDTLTETEAARAHYATAAGLHAACRYDEALSYLRGYLQAEPDGPYAARALVRMAEIHRTEAYQGYDPERARALLAEVVARFPGSAAAATACELEPTVCPSR
jgi:TolA-binding protein